MIEIFRKNIFINSLLLIPYIILVRIKSFIRPEAYQILETDGPVASFLFPFFSNSGIVQAIIVVLLIFFQAAIVNRMVNLSRIENENTLFPGVFYILMCSSLPDFLILSPLLIGTTFILIAFSSIFGTYKKPKTEHLIFNTGFWIGIAALFYMPFLLFIIPGIVSLMILRSFKLKELFQIITGCAIPFFLLGAVLFWNDKLPELSYYFGHNIGYFEKIRGLTRTEIFSFSIVTLFVITSVLNYGPWTSRKNIQITKKIDILYWCLFVGILAFGFRQPDQLLDLQLISFPGGIMLASFFLKIKNRTYTELIHLIIVTLMIIGHFNF